METGLRWLVALFFVAVALPKLFEPTAFAEQVGAYGMVPDPWVHPLALLLPPLEIGFAILALRGHLAGKVGLTLLLLVFIVVLSLALSMGLDIDCGCYGPNAPEHKAFAGLREALLRDIVLLLMMAYSLWWHRRHHTRATITRGEET